MAQAAGQHVVQHGQVRHQVKTLAHDSHQRGQIPARLQVCGGFAVDDNGTRSLVGHQGAGQQAQQRGLAAARGADQRHPLAGMDGKTQRRKAAVISIDLCRALYSDKRLGRSNLLASPHWADCAHCIISSSRATLSIAR